MNEEQCPECKSALEYDEVDVGVGVQRGNYFCPNCHWHPGARKVPCNCGCGKWSYDGNVEFNHPEDYQLGEQGCD